MDQAESPPKTNSDPEKEANDIARRDLAAQQTMALATEELVKIAWVQIALSGIGILLVWLTLRYTRRALREAEEATKAGVAAATAAGEANKITRERTTAERRPWLSFELTPSGELEMWPTSCGIPVDLKINNHGHDPATNVRCNCRVDDSNPCQITRQLNSLVQESIDHASETLFAGIVFNDAVEEGAAYRAAVKEGFNFNSFYLFWCITYFGPDGSTVYYTADAFQVMGTGETRPVGAAEFLRHGKLGKFDMVRLNHPRIK